MDEFKRELATGYNGPQRGAPHCIDTPCVGVLHEPGTGLSVCEAIHAEANALMRCPDVLAARYCFVTVSPCVDCVKLLLNTGVFEIVFRRPYSHDRVAGDRWCATGRYWTQYNTNGTAVQEA